jgi:NAD(P)H-hydrate epimerase
MLWARSIIMNQSALPTLTSAAWRTVSHLLDEEYQITPEQSLELAGYHLAVLAATLLDDDLADRPLVVLAGRGNNGSGGLVAARHLLNWGAWVQIVLAQPMTAFAGPAARQLQSLRAIDAPLAWAEEGWELPPADLVIDALVGTGLQGAPHGAVRDLIQLANSSHAPILSLDLPSGVGPDVGMVYTPHIQAAATLAVALPKAIFVDPAAQPALGDLYLADVGAPPALYAALGLSISALFPGAAVVPLAIDEGAVVIAA